MKDGIPYYKREAEHVYNEIKEKGLTCWSELFENCRYEDFPGRSFWRAVLARYPDYFSGSDVFEYGCGTGPLSCFLSEYVKSVHATDVSPTAIEMAKKLCKKENVNFQTMDFAIPQKCDKSFELVADNYVAQQLADIDSRNNVFGNAFKLLSDEGIYVMTTIVSEDKDFVSKEKMREGVKSVRLHRSPKNIKKELKNHGFEIKSLIKSKNRICVISGKK